MDKGTKRGKFIVFEALDGSGTSTQARLLHDYFSEKGERVYLTEEPSPGPIGNMIRWALTRRLRMSTDQSLNDRQLALLFAADRHDHLYNQVDGIMPKIAEGWIVICTRYVLSSIVYNSQNDRELQFVQRLNSEFPLPDLTIYLDCPIEVCVQRLNDKRPVQDIYENYEKLNRVKKKYSKLLKEYPAPLDYVDGTLDKLGQHRRIIQIIEKTLVKINSEKIT